MVKISRLEVFSMGQRRGHQHTNLEGVNHCFIRKSSLFLFSSLCGVAWISVPLKSGELLTNFTMNV